MRFLWRHLDGPSRFSSAMGIVAGVWGVFLILFALSQALGSEPIGSLIVLFAILEFLLLFLSAPILVMAGGLTLMTVEMSQYHRGILGFMVFVTAALILFFCWIITYAFLVHTSL